MNRKTARSVLCIVLVLILVLSLVSVLAPVRAGAVSQSEIDALEAKRDQIQAQQKTQQQNINNLKSQQASVVEQKEALDQENELARQEIAVVEEQIEAYNGLIDEKTVELEEAKAEEEEQAVRKLYSSKNARAISILYGGSMNDLMCSTELLLAASSSKMLYERPSANALQLSHSPHASPSTVGFMQLIALAKMRAHVVLPTPRGPQNR